MAANVALLLASLAPLAAGTAINNGIIGSPEVFCESNQLRINFQSERSFEGNVYVKGYFENPQCYAGPTGTRESGIIIPFSSPCGLRRIRRTGPRGLSLVTTIVIMFHSQFLTKIDRAFRVECFYMEADKSVSASFDVSMLTTLAIDKAIDMPACSYSVLSRDINGQPVRYARIGDKVYHHWSCSGGQASLFCMTVHSCTVDDGRGAAATQLVDERGCAQDRYLLAALEYVSDTEAGQTSHVFKFADKPSLFFTCQIRLALRPVGARCERPAERCPDLVGKQRRRRSVGSAVDVVNAAVSRYLVNLDAPAGPIDVLEIQEPGEDAPWEQPSEDAADVSRRVCVTPLGLGFVSALGLSLLCCVSLLVYTSLSRRRASCACAAKKSEPGSAFRAKIWAD